MTDNKCTPDADSTGNESIRINMVSILGVSDSVTAVTIDGASTNFHMENTTLNIGPITTELLITTQLKINWS